MPLLRLCALICHAWLVSGKKVIPYQSSNTNQHTLQKSKVKSTLAEVGWTFRDRNYVVSGPILKRFVYKQQLSETSVTSSGLNAAQTI